MLDLVVLAEPGEVSSGLRAVVGKYHSQVPEHVHQLPEALDHHRLGVQLSEGKDPQVHQEPVDGGKVVAPSGVKQVHGEGLHGSTGSQELASGLGPLRGEMFPTGSTIAYHQLDVAVHALPMVELA